MQWCVNTALLLPETQQCCSPGHAAPTWAPPAWLALPGARGQGCCQWAGTFLHRCLWANPASWKWASWEPWSRNTEWAEKEKLFKFVIIQGIQPLIIVCNGELKSIKTKHWGGHWLSLFITTFPSATASALSWQKQFPATQELAIQSAGARGEPYCVAPFQCWDLLQGKTCLQKSWLCHQEAASLKTIGIEYDCLGDGQTLHVFMCSCLPPLLPVRGLTWVFC